MKFKLVGQELKYIPGSVVGDSVNYEYAEFELTEEFLTGTITAYFRTYTSPPTETPVILTDGKCLVPEAHLKGKHVYVWLTRLSGDIFVPTTIAKVPINASGANGETYSLPDAQENLYEAVVRMYNEFIAGGGSGAISITANAVANTVESTELASANVSVVDNVLSFTFNVPKGQQGIQGDTPIKGTDYFDGEKGDPGANGLSAYQIAINNGFTGTESEWLESLNGEPGQTPVKGTDYLTQAEVDAIKSDVVNAVQPQLTKVFQEFLSIGANVLPWQASAINSGTLQNVSGSLQHPGVVSFSSSTTANSGYYALVGSGTILLNGGEKSTIIFKTASTLTGVTRRMGFHECTSVSDGADGVYGEIVDGVLSGKTASASVLSATTTNYTLSANTWYRLVIQLNSNATLATYTLYEDNSDTVLWTDTLSANIPTGTGRELRHGDIVTSSGTTAMTLGYLDYMDIMLNARKV